VTPGAGDGDAAPRNPPASARQRAIPDADDLLRAGEISFHFFRSSGPGGQNVNKVSTAVRLRFNLRGSQLLPEGVKRRLALLAGSRLIAEGVLVIEAQRHRTQEGNRRDALERLGELIERAWRPPAPRHATKPSRAARQRRLDEKKGRGATKRQRARPADAE
jgi:ribosome-associated protein